MLDPISNPASATTSPTTDFNPTQIATTVSKHDEEFIVVRSRLDELEQKLSNPEKFAIIFESLQKDSKKMDNLLSGLFCSLLERDEKVKEAIEKHIQKSDRTAIWKITKRFGWATWSLILFILGLVAKGFIDQLFK